MERKLLKALIARRLRERLHTAKREYGSIFKELGIDAKEAQLLALELLREICDLAISKLEQETGE